MHKFHKLRRFILHSFFPFYCSYYWIIGNLGNWSFVRNIKCFFFPFLLGILFSLTYIEWMAKTLIYDKAVIHRHSVYCTSINVIVFPKTASEGWFTTWILAKQRGRNRHGQWWSMTSNQACPKYLALLKQPWGTRRRLNMILTWVSL